MKITKLYPSHFIQRDPEFIHSQSIVPFYPSHQAAREAFGATIKAGENYLVQEANTTIYLTATITSGSAEIRNMLCSDLEVSQGRLSLVLDKFARRYFSQKLVLVLPPTPVLSHSLADWGLEAAADHYEKNISYRTALVLGGGGARGAYQIGAWQALQELGIDFQIITGTSVGALNGALILQDDLPAAQELWRRMNTDQVLQFPEAAKDSKSLGELLGQVNSLTVTALRENGASVEPLLNLMKEKFSAEKMAASDKELYTTATHLPDFKEVHHHFNKQQELAELPWLIASASFYPAMKTTEIDGELYMDGGYRNNLPEDLAIEAGARECLLIDVKGPGFVKHINRPTEVLTIELNSPWSLGSFLVFSQDRSKENEQLGYLETKKAFGEYVGYWYTFPQEAFQVAWWAFCQQERKADSPLWRTVKKPSFLEKLRGHGDVELVFEQAGRGLLEYLGSVLKIPPYLLYDEATFLEKLQGAFVDQQEPISAALSISEWLRVYRERIVFWSESRQLLYLHRQGEQDRTRLVEFLELAPELVMALNFLTYTIENSERGNE